MGGFDANTGGTSLDDVSALLRYARSGDAAAFELLIHRYGTMVLATCRRRLSSDADAEDAAQETFLRLARDASRVRSNLAGWLHACAVGTSVDLVRRGGARVRAESRVVTPERVDTAEDSAMFWRDIEPIIDEALTDLDMHDRELLVARFLAQRPQFELARQWGVSEGTISRRISRALDRLRARLAARGLAIASAGSLGVVLGHAAAQAAPLGVPAGLGKIAMTGIGARPAKAFGVIGWSSAAMLAGASVTIGLLLLAPGGGGVVPGASTATSLSVDSKRSTELGPARPRRSLGPFQIISAYDEDFNSSGTFVTRDGIAIRRGNEPESGAPRRIRLDIVETRPQDDDPSTKQLREVAEIDVLTARVLPKDDEWARFRRGENLTLLIAFDQFDRIVIREKDGKVQIGKNEPTWYGVRPPPGWDQRDEIPEDPGPLGILGPWTESERIGVTISGEEIRFGPENWNAGRYRVIEWEQREGYSRVLSAQAGGRDPRLIGTRFKLLIREQDDGYEIAYFPPSTGRSNRWPSSFEHTRDNPVRLVKLGRDG